jgi:hypothetical protein
VIAEAIREQQGTTKVALMRERYLDTKKFVGEGKAL